MLQFVRYQKELLAEVENGSASFQWTFVQYANGRCPQIATIQSSASLSSSYIMWLLTGRRTRC